MMLENWIREARRIKMYLTSGRQASQDLRDLRREQSGRDRKEWRLLDIIDIALDDAEHHSGWFIDAMEKSADRVVPKGAETFTRAWRAAEKAETLAAMLLAESPKSLNAEAAEFYELAVQAVTATFRLEARSHGLLRKIEEQRHTLDPRRTFNDADRALLFAEAGGQCQSCGETLGADWQADHVHPHSLGGPTHISNGQALCAPCNRRKGARVLTMDQEKGTTT